MHNSSTQGIIILIAGSSILLLLLISFIITIVYKYQQKQNIYFKEIEILKRSHENTLLQSQLEIQEQTFQTISWEIHDNIGQKLTLAKLQLNTLPYININELKKQVQDSVNIMTEAISDLTNLSRSLSSEIVLSNGLIQALELETSQLKKTGIYQVGFAVTGNPVFLDKDTELMLFRMVQEALNNVIKHAQAVAIDIELHYTSSTLILQIRDNGKGFNSQQTTNGTGLHNINKRAAILKGRLSISSILGTGTLINIEIPLDNDNKTLQTNTGR